MKECLFEIFFLIIFTMPATQTLIYIFKLNQFTFFEQQFPSSSHSSIRLQEKTKFWHFFREFLSHEWNVKQSRFTGQVERNVCTLVARHMPLLCPKWSSYCNSRALLCCVWQ